MRLFPILLAVFFTLTGCRSPEEPLPYPLTFGSEGLGPIRLGGDFDIASIQGKLPGFTVEKMSLVTSGKPETLFLLKRGEHVIAQIVPDAEGKHISQITLLTERIQDVRGHKIGEALRGELGLSCTKDECRCESDRALHYRIDPDSRIIREITVQKL